MKIISDTDVIRHIRGEKNRYIPWIGAGFSAEAKVPTAQKICEDVRELLLRSATEIDKLNFAEVERWQNEYLEWNNPSKRYLTCIEKGYPNEARRNEFFYSLLLDKQPSLCHYSLALLLEDNFFNSTCITTNFDHLVEIAFIQQDIIKFQVIRTDGECKLWKDWNDRLYIVKVHGDFDTQNIMNTRKETRDLTEGMKTRIFSICKDSGLLVIGTTGNEKSIRKFFEELGKLSEQDRTICSFGIFWGVYLGDKKPNNFPEDEMKKLVEKNIKSEINPDIIDVLCDSQNSLFCFFPVWGAGNFMLNLVKETDNKELISRATRQLDHRMRLRLVFNAAGLADSAIDGHIQRLEKQSKKLENLGLRPPTDLIIKSISIKSNIELQIKYGDITSRSLMSSEEFRDRRKAIVSPEDTCISAGGGVAYSLLLKSGDKFLLNELGKFAPIEQNNVVVTSAGNLPIHYILHAASLKIQKDGSYLVNKDNVKKTMDSVLDKIKSLEIEVLWIPLLAAGVASLKPLDSFKAILNSIRDYDMSNTNSLTKPLTIIVMIYEEKLLQRSCILENFKKILSYNFK